MNAELPTLIEISKTIDHALLKPAMTMDEVREGLELAVEYDVFSVCVRPADIKFAVNFLKHTNVKVGTVIGFPHGANHTQTKKFETMQAAIDGADEVDMVLNISWLRSGMFKEVQKEIEEIVEVANYNRIQIIKVIFETAYLTSYEIAEASKITEKAGADFVKTSTGFAGEGATIPNLQVMRENVSAGIEVKASGGVTDLDTLLEMKSLGVTRFGTSATKTILDDLKHRIEFGKPLTKKHKGSY